MTDVSGIPNMGFGGGGYFGGNAATGQPAMSAAQINQGIWGNYSPQQAQTTFNQITGPLTQDPARYAGIGAAYGRATGGFGLMPRDNSVFSTGASAVPHTSSANYFGAFPSPKVGSMALPSTGYPTTPSTFSGNWPTPQAAPNFEGAASALMAQRNFTQPASFDSRFNALLPKVNPGISNFFDSVTQGAREAPFLQKYGQPSAFQFSGGAQTPRVPLPVPRAAVPQIGDRDAIAAAFMNRSPNSAVEARFGQMQPSAPPDNTFASRFGGMQTPQFSAAGIALADRLRGQGPPSLSPFLKPNAYQPR